MTILITGATGLIGTELSKLLIEKKYTIHYLTTAISKIKNKTNYKGFYWNPAKGEIDQNCLQNVDVIVHLAGANIAKRWTKSYKQELVESRLDTANLLFQLVKNNSNQVQQIISASATAIYPNSETEVYTENSKVSSNDFLSNLVEKWEESVAQFQRLHIKTTFIRTGVVYAKNGGALSEMIRPIKLRLGAAFGSGKQVQSWIHLHDLARLYLFCIENKIEGIINGVSTETITNQNLTKLIAINLKKPLFLPNIPRFIMKLILGEMHELVFDNKKIIPQRAIESGFEFEFASPTKAIENILK